MNRSVPLKLEQGLTKNRIEKKFKGQDEYGVYCTPNHREAGRSRGTSGPGARWVKQAASSGLRSRPTTDGGGSMEVAATKGYVKLDQKDRVVYSVVQQGCSKKKKSYRAFSVTH